MGNLEARARQAERMDCKMRKSGIIVIVLLLVAVLAVMIVSVGLLPLPFSNSGTIGTNLSINMPFSNSLEVETEYVAELRPKLAVDTPHGHVVVQGAAVEKIQISMNVQVKASTPLRTQELMGAVSLEINTTAEGNSLKVHMPLLRNNEQARADLKILVPAETELDVKTNLGQVEIANIRDSIRVLSQLGAIKVRNFEGDAYLETALGNIEISAAQFSRELVAFSHLGDLVIEASLGGHNVLESSLGDLTLLLSPDESYILEGSVSLGGFDLRVPFKGQQSRNRIQGVVGEGEQRGSISVDLSLGSLNIKNQMNGRD